MVGGESGPLDTLPKGKPVATTTAAIPSTTRVPVTTSAPAPTSTTLPVGGVQPPTEIIPGVIELPPDPDHRGSGATTAEHARTRTRACPARARLLTRFERPGQRSTR